MDAPGLAHVAFGFASLMLGLGVFCLSKGTAPAVAAPTIAVTVLGGGLVQFLERRTMLRLGRRRSEKRTEPAQVRS
jgi:hypothetical protein